ncbi:hypothetical protein BN2476_630082 [Paraburkholderia piptadeniae]|uniref:Uncharacterized protein n=1 Tax=Paraburkholderia piptadeniae TaxID=1701573 RepID=A0A1N7SLT8_9BURK|nr:hypothetical protein BN2476_630082 [Paraburkholderia piptadeniae]
MRGPKTNETFRYGGDGTTASIERNDRPKLTNAVSGFPGPFALSHTLPHGLIRFERRINECACPIQNIAELTDTEAGASIASAAFTRTISTDRARDAAATMLRIRRRA